MHNNILNQNQIDLIPLVSSFPDHYYLVGGTALALQLGHRQSIDYDLFTPQRINHQDIINTIKSKHIIDRTIIDNISELTLLVNQVRLTFYTYPYQIDHQVAWQSKLTLPSILSIGAMKAYALGRRAKWKDYVDLYFILKEHSFTDLISHTQNIFQAEFDEKLFREQLAYHKDINFTEEVVYMPSHKTAQSTILDFLLKTSLT